MNPVASVALQLDSLGAWGLALFVACYIVATVVFVPGAVLTLAAGAAFGLSRGTAIVFLGAVLGSSTAFALARGLAHRRVALWLAKDPRMLAVNQAVAGRGFWVVVLLRLSPVIPYNVINYALGLTGVRYRDFLTGSVGMLPGTLFYAYSGKVVGDVALVASGISPPRGDTYYALLSVGLVATGAVALLLGRTARAALTRDGSADGQRA